jgi:tRNA-specific 2-thiouridylase
MSSKKILVAVSGGVDSAVAAALLARKGMQVEGAYMKNWMNEPGLAGDCPWQQDIEDARRACGHLGIPFRVINLMDAYRERVVEYLLEGYKSGVTPNPDVMCNREIKFGVFLKKAHELGFDAVATGHYARVRRGLDGEPELWEGVDKNKDQSYFLALMQRPQLENAIFPLGELTKQHVRTLAREFGLPNAEKKDSQGICFVGKVKMMDFLRAYVPDEPGEVIDIYGKRLGTHRGLHLYTIGQKRGVGIASPVFGQAYVVVDKRLHTRELVLALEKEAESLLLSTSCEVGSLSFPGRVESLDGRFLVRPRYRAPSVPARIRPLSCGGVAIEFEKPQRAITPGQIAAIYDGERLVAGGIFRAVKRELQIKTVGQ